MHIHCFIRLGEQRLHSDSGIRSDADDPQAERQGMTARLKVMGLHITLQASLHVSEIAFGRVDNQDDKLVAPPRRPMTSESRKVSVKMTAK